MGKPRLDSCHVQSRATRWLSERGRTGSCQPALVAIHRTIYSCKAIPPHAAGGFCLSSRNPHPSTSTSTAAHTREGGVAVHGYEPDHPRQGPGVHPRRQGRGGGLIEDFDPFSHEGRIELVETVDVLFDVGNRREVVVGEVVPRVFAPGVRARNHGPLHHLHACAQPSRSTWKDVGCATTNKNPPQRAVGLLYTSRLCGG